MIPISLLVLAALLLLALTLSAFDQDAQGSHEWQRRQDARERPASPGRRNRSAEVIKLRCVQVQAAPGFVRDVSICGLTVTTAVS